MRPAKSNSPLVLLVSYLFSFSNNKDRVFTVYHMDNVSGRNAAIYVESNDE